MRQGIETVKPDVHVRRFAEGAVGRGLSDAVLAGHYARGREADVGIVGSDRGRRGGRSAYRAHNYDTHCEERHHHHYGAVQFLQATTRAGARRTLESLARIEAGAEGGALIERTTTTRTAKSGTITTTVRERFTPPDWRADGWFLERRHPAEWSRRTELVVPDHDQAAAVDPLVGVHDELRLARLARQKQQGKFV